MKTKNKMLAMVEIATLLCSIFLVAIPAIAADQNQGMQKVSASAITTASEDDYVLEIYGNANEDDTIDMGDVVYTKLAIFGKKPKTELCDAKYDGRINVLDVIQTKLIILGKEKELTIVDILDRIVTVKKPIKRIIPFSSYVTDTLRSIKATDKIVGVPGYVINQKTFFPEFGDFPNLGTVGAGTDYEKIVELQPDVFFLYRGYDAIQTRVESLIPGIAVVRVDCSAPDDYTEEVTKLGYILNRKQEAEEFIDFYENFLNQIDEKVKMLSEDEKPRVFYTYPTHFPGTYYTVGRLCGVDHAIVRAGGINIAADIGIEAKNPVIDPEWVLEQNPEIILGSGMGTKMGYEGDCPTEAEMEDLRDIIMLQPGWGHIAAVESNKVYLVHSKLLDRTGHHFIGTAYIAKLFHPDIFEDLDPQAIHQEYIDKFCGMDFDVKNDGVFIYPPLEES